MDNQTLDTLGLTLIACCIIPFMLITVATVWTLRYGRAYIIPDFADMQADFLKLKNKYPHEADSKLAQRIINKQARRSGVIGALTSVGGIFILPFGLALDMYSSARIQNTMLQFLAWVYAPSTNASSSLALLDALKLQSNQTAQNLAIAGTHRLSRGIYRRVMVEVAEKSFAKLIPIIGLAFGYGVNYFATRGMGEAVRRYYENR